MHQQMREVLESDSRYQEALQIIRRNTTGKIYVVGGYVYRKLVKGKEAAVKDIDFLIQELEEPPKVPKSWQLKRNRYHHPYFIGKRGKIDPIQLTKHVYIQQMDLPQTLESYLQVVPLNIQSIAFDTDEKVLIGNEGLQAIKDKTIRFNNKDEAKFCCNHFQGYSIEEMLIKTAESLDFNYHL